MARVIKSEELFKSKNELVKFARYLGINVNAKSSYTQTLKRISNYIYLNRKEYSEKYVLYRNGDEECILEPEKIKLDLIESYKSKTRDDMRSIARLLNIKVDEEDGAEDIRKKVINYIIKEKVDMINNHISPIQDKEIEEFLKTKDLNLKATLDKEVAFKNAKFVVISTPTNYDETKNYNNCFLCVYSNNTLCLLQ